jgi:hypothetical protein
LIVAASRPRLEISQVGRRLILLGGHKMTVGTQHVTLPGDFEMLVALRAN